MIKSVYIHIPFCNNICTYCDFAKVFSDENKIFDYLINLKREVKKRYNGEDISSIYIGGGTPSSLNNIQLDKLFEIVKLFNLDKKVEFTFECNIEDIGENLLKYLKASGVNRISVGVQTFNSKHLSTLGRIHTKELAIENLKKVKKHFNNFSVDLIYAIPNQTLKELENDLNILLKLSVPHISCYSLQIEEHTKLYIDKVSNIDEETDYLMYQLIKEKLKSYNHYEISNFSKKNFSSKHNLVYWNNEEYYGFGIGAASYTENKRLTNTRSFNKYFSGNYIYEEELLSKNDKIKYELILGFRKIKGINKRNFFDKYKEKLEDKKEIKELINENKLLIQGDFIFINPKYIYVSNEILSRLV